MVKSSSKNKAIEFLKSIDKIDETIYFSGCAILQPEGFERFKNLHLKTLERYPENSLVFQSHLHRIRILYKTLNKKK